MVVPARTRRAATRLSCAGLDVRRFRAVTRWPGQTLSAADVRQLKYWHDAWLDRIFDLYAAHDELTAAWQAAATPAPQQEQAAAARL
jgi:hypothetical protein